MVPFIKNEGHEVSLLVRKPEEAIALFPDCILVKGDIFRENLGIDGAYFDRVYHIAGSVNLAKKAETLRVNAEGSYNVCKYVLSNRIPHLVHVSTAYLFGRNWYEISKKVADDYVLQLSKGGVFGVAMERIEFDPVKVSLFRPGILIGEDGLSQAFPTFVRYMARVHRRAEPVRRKIEGTLRLPPVEAVLRLKGNPEGRLNLVHVEDVAEKVAKAEEGVFYLTNPSPPTLEEVVRWIGETLWLRINMVREFNSTPIEAVLQRLTKAFSPYLQGDELPSDIPIKRRINKELVQHIVELVCCGANPRVGYLQ